MRKIDSPKIVAFRLTFYFVMGILFGMTGTIIVLEKMGWWLLNNGTMLGK